MTDTPMPLGRLHFPDPKNDDYPARPLLRQLAATAALPRPSPWYRTGGLFDQNVRGSWNHDRPESSCTMQTLVGAVMTTPCRTKALGAIHGLLARREWRLALLDPAVRYEAYRRSQTLDPWPGDEETPPTYEGATGSAAVKALMALGYLPKTWSYLWCRTVDEVRSALRLHGAVATGTDWTERMFTPDRRGVVTPDGDVAGGHEYLIRWDDDDDDELWCDNSWGPHWGPLGGHFRIKVNRYAELLERNGDALILVPG